MACERLPDCVLKQNLFLHILSFLAKMRSFLLVIFSHPLRAVMKSGSKITKASKRKHKCILRPRVA
jgi:hypothetical protein